MSLEAWTVREVAVILFVADCVLCDDFQNGEDGLPWARNLFASIDTDPLWSDGKHHGDCTKHPHTCTRCVVEKYEAEARRRYEE